MGGPDVTSARTDRGSSVSWSLQARARRLTTVRESVRQPRGRLRGRPGQRAARASGTSAPRRPQRLTAGDLSPAVHVCRQHARRPRGPPTGAEARLFGLRCDRCAGPLHPLLRKGRSTGGAGPAREQTLPTGLAIGGLEIELLLTVRSELWAQSVPPNVLGVGEHAGPEGSIRRRLRPDPVEG